MKKSERDCFPLDGEVNPNHQMTQFARNQWHKIAALLMQELGRDELEITPQMIARMGDNEKAIVIDGRNDKLVIRMVTMEEGERLARMEGGLPA